MEMKIGQMIIMIYFPNFEDEEGQMIITNYSLASNFQAFYLLVGLGFICANKV